MPEIRYWSPGRGFKTALPGRTWFIEDADALTAAVVLYGAWGTNRPELMAAAGPWDEDVDQVWTVRIPKTACMHPGDADPFWYWEWALAELYDKPHRAISTGMDDGEFVSRVPVTDLAGVKLTWRGLVHVATPRDRRALRLAEQRSLRAALRQRAHRRKQRQWKDAETRQGEHWRGRNRWRRRRDQEARRERKARNA